ncbi:pseudouridine synthase [Spirosoma validum]|uniref:Pseudouridine synthase n=1 Tax=Spirosoma validum TaxID=2771355 RepID=A0A927AXM5_9BACT|nr:pseudouridine synthase [Spirosoma validum]MBD2751685.1 pseudouridine synthase [Spirosoma validum]
MNQDSDRDKPRRDGEPLRRSGRPFDRRDDGRNADTPRFNRSRNDNPATERDNKFDRQPRNDGDARTPNRDSRPPRFERDGGSRNNEHNNDDRRPRSDRDSRPSFNRDNRSRDDKPRFDKDRRDSRTDESRPRFDRDNRSGNSEPRRPFSDRRDDRFGRTDETPRFDRDNNRPDRNVNRFGNEPPRRTERFPERNDNDRPRFDRDRPDQRTNREERPRFNADRTKSNDRREGGGNRPRRGESSSRSYGNDRNDRFPTKDSDRNNNDQKPRFSRDVNRSGGHSGSDKPGFKRVGGFSREADERNKARFNDDNQRSGGRREARSKDSREEGWTNETRFSGQQRKESGDRRTGFFTKAPNYSLAQPRSQGSFKQGRSGKPRDEQEGSSETPKRAPANDGTTRLNRYIANSGVCSRREADELIGRGDISVNGKVVTEMGYKVKEGDTVKYGTKVLNPERFVYVLLNKPKDYITTTEDPEERKTVMELVADAGNFRMYPVGRLDRNTTGLLLLTNDGELADKLTHPSNNIRKIYQIELDKPITDEHFEAIKKGIELEDGPIKPDALSIITPDAHVVGIEIHSGRNRIVRRIFENFGYEVTKLDRTTYAGLTKKELPRGKWRFLDPKEVVKLKYFN